MATSLRLPSIANLIRASRSGAPAALGSHIGALATATGLGTTAAPLPFLWVIVARLPPDSRKTVDRLVRAMCDAVGLRRRSAFALDLPRGRAGAPDREAIDLIGDGAGFPNAAPRL